MNKNIKLSLIPVAAILLGGCSQELPFDGPNAEGYLNRDAMGVDMKNSDLLGSTRANIDMGEFRIEILKQSTGELVRSYRYADMPEIVALPVGEYSVNAVYGEDHPNKWENPYYVGDSEFTIESGKITEDLEPVVCKLSNIRIKVKFGPYLSQSMSADSKVEVRVGQTGALDFTKADQERAGYFAFTPGSQSITATFNGMIDGEPVNETKSYDNAAAGNIYTINFSLHSPDGEDPGDISGNLAVDASIEYKDLTLDIDPDDEYQQDDMRPKEDDGDEPNPPTPPTPPTGNEGPSIEAQGNIDLTKENVVTVGDRIVLVITSEDEGGITEFKVHIDSPTLTEDILEVADLTTDLDLVNTDEAAAESLTNLGLPSNIGGEKEVVFDISSFIEMMNMLGEASHTFTLKVSDATGTNQKDLILKNVK